MELDRISGRIAKLLYPNARIRLSGYEKAHFPENSFDLAIGNVPFGQYQVNDPQYNRLGFSIHNYFIAKSLDMVHPGGVLAFITTRYTMDSRNKEARGYFAQKADLLGAVRLPNNAFKANANTEVVSDILFLQKRDTPADEAPEWVQTGTNPDGFTINRYFLNHPEMVLGEESSESSQYGGQDYTVMPVPDIGLATQLQAAVESIHGTYQEAAPAQLGENPLSDTVPADTDIKKYSFMMINSEIYYCGSSTMDKAGLNKTVNNRVKGMIELRDCVHGLIRLVLCQEKAQIKCNQFSLF